MAPKIPVVTAKIAVRVGETPMRSAIPIAIGAVTDFGYIAPVMVLSAPSSVAIPTALTIQKGNVQDKKHFKYMLKTVKYLLKKDSVLLIFV